MAVTDRVVAIFETTGAAAVSIYRQVDESIIVLTVQSTISDACAFFSKKERKKKENVCSCDAASLTVTGLFGTVEPSSLANTGNV